MLGNKTLFKAALGVLSLGRLNLPSVVFWLLLLKIADDKHLNFSEGYDKRIRPFDKLTRLNVSINIYVSSFDSL